MVRRVTRSCAPAHLLLLASCLGPGALTPQQIDAAHRVCKDSIARGQTHLARSDRLGLVTTGRPSGTPVLLIGAPWCNACVVAASYLRAVGIPYVEQDIERDPGATGERDRLLAAAGLAATTELPVIAVHHAVLVGFDSCALEAAWEAP